MHHEKDINRVIIFEILWLWQMNSMELEENKTSALERKLIFAIAEHEVLGMLIEAYIVEITRFRQFSLSSRRVSIHTVKDYVTSLSESERQILQMIDQYSDDEILKRFGKRYNKPAEFYKYLPEELLKEHIRPYIDRRIARVIRLMAAENIVLYLKGKKREPVNEHPVKIIPEPARVIFHFTRTENGIEYKLTVKFSDQELLLAGKNWKVITVKPCWILRENSLITFDERVDAKKLIPFFSKGTIQIPPTAEKKYLETFMLNAVKNFEVAATGFSIEDIRNFQKAFLTFDSGGLPLLVLSFEYGLFEVMYDEPDNTVVRFIPNSERYRYVRIFRDRVKEDALVEWIKEMGLMRQTGGQFRLKMNDEQKNQFPISELIEWINSNASALAEKGIIVRQRGTYHYYTGTITIKQSIADKTDWFDLKIMVHFGDMVVPFIKFRDNILSGTREYLLPDGSVAVLPKEWFSKYRDLVQLSSAGQDVFRVRKCHLHILDESIAGEKIPLAEKLKHGIKILDTDRHNLPEGLEAKLRPYQIIGYQWLRILQELGLGGCLADDMGLGKTLQALAILANTSGKKSILHIKNASNLNKQLSLFGNPEAEMKIEANTSLIVMPLSLIWNWENEIRKFAPKFRVYKHIGVGRISKPEDFFRYDIVLTTYGIVRNDLELLKKCEFRYVILDESQMIKNPFSKIFRAVRQLRAKYKLVLTGTPIENSLTDLWAQMTFINEGILGNLSYFKNEFLVPIEKNGDREKEEKLKKIIAPFILRRTKDMVAKDLPSLTEQVYYCAMSDTQRELYETRKSEIRNILIDSIATNGLERSRFVILKGLMELRLLANHPKLLVQTSDGSSGKYEEVMRSVENILSEQHKVLIFSSFVRHLNVFARAFGSAGWQYEMLTGQTPSAERMQKVKRFQEDPQVQIFLMTMKAGGVGINLTAADYVFILDPWWNPAVENQAIARAHRIGQEKNVIAYKFITQDSIEEKILNLQHRKSELADLFIMRNDPLPFFTRETIIQLTE